jgi:hypothetical protein
MHILQTVFKGKNTGNSCLFIFTVYWIGADRRRLTFDRQQALTSDESEKTPEPRVIRSLAQSLAHTLDNRPLILLTAAAAKVKLLRASDGLLLDDEAEQLGFGHNGIHSGGCNQWR